MYAFNNCWSGKSRARQRRAWRRTIGWVLTTKVMATLAAVTVTPYAAGGYEYESNPFYEWNGASVGNGAGDTPRKLRAGMDAQLVWSRQSLQATAEVRRIDYRDFSFLGHTEALLNGTFRWAVTSLVDGSAEYRHERRMVPFDELPATVREILLETEDIGGASLNVQTLDGWRLESRGSLRNLSAPRPGFPELNLREDSIHEALRRTFGSLALGLDAEYLSGSYTGAGELGTPRYTQTSVLLAAERKVAGLSTFQSAVGYTYRAQSQVGGNVSAVTGTLGYQRDLSSKTSVGVLLTRAINSYVTAAGSEIDTGLSLNANWQATSKIRVTPAYTLMHSDFPRLTLDSGPGRHDRYQVVALDIRYQALSWLLLRTYGRYDLRSSNVPTFGFNASAIGLELVFKESQ
jgi:hypothetical protein